MLLRVEMGDDKVFRSVAPENDAELVELLVMYAKHRPSLAACLNKVLDAIGTDTFVGHLCRVFSVNEKILLGSSRTADCRRARQLGMYYLRRNTKLSYSQIGRMFNRDHTTVIYSIKVVSDELSTSAGFRNDLKKLIKSSEPCI